MEKGGIRECGSKGKSALTRSYFAPIGVGAIPKSRAHRACAAQSLILHSCWTHPLAQAPHRHIAQHFFLLVWALDDFLKRANELLLIVD